MPDRECLHVSGGSCPQGIAPRDSLWPSRCKATRGAVEEVIMDERTEAALRKSIAHWQDNVNATSRDDVSVGPRACALCVEFHDKGCVGCPVRDKTGF